MPAIPLKLYLVLAAVLAALAATGGFYLWARHQGAAAERPKTEAAGDDAAARALEADGERASASRLDAYARTTGAAQAGLATLAHAAGAAADASQPLAADRASRLLADDRRLCDLDPPICAAATVAAATGGGALQSATPASGAKPG